MSIISRKTIVLVPLAGFLFLFSSCESKDPKNIEDFQELLSELDGRNADIMKKQEEIRTILEAYNRKVPENRKVTFSLQEGWELTGRQERLLQDMIRSEKDISYQGLLRSIVEKNDEIRSFRDEIRKLEEHLPKPYNVKQGDTHYRLCLKYLTDIEGLSRAKADSLIDRIALVADLVRGFQVWFYYREGVFGSSVTQGTANVSPSRLARITRRKMIEEARRQGREEAYGEILDSLLRNSMRDSSSGIAGDTIQFP